MKVLIITYYWPPAGGSGVQRWLKFAKYLPNFSVEPIIYTVKDANYPKLDDSLLDEIPNNIKVLKKTIWQPTDLFFWKRKKKQSNVSNAVNNGLLSFVRGNFFIPDPKIFWVKKSVKFLTNYLAQNPVDAIISTGPPHSMHLIGQKLAKKLPVKWIADFRDPWSDLYYNLALKQLHFAKKKNKKLENLVLTNADCVITVSDFLKQDLEKKAKRVEVITNGFDDETQKNSQLKLDKKFTISYIGLLPKQSNPLILFEVLHQLCKEKSQFAVDLQLNFVGDICDDVKLALKENNLMNKAKFYGYVSHQKAIEFQNKAQVLLLLIPNVHKSEGILTGKLFEYLTSKRPILALGSEKGDLAKILDNTNTGKVFSYQNEVALKKHVEKLYQDFKNNTLQVQSSNIQQYHRKNLTKQFVEVLKSLHS